MEARDSPHEENRNTGVVLRALEVEILVHVIDFGVDDGVTVEETQKVHQPENRLFVLVSDSLFLSRDSPSSSGLASSPRRPQQGSSLATLRTCQVPHVEA